MDSKEQHLREKFEVFNPYAREAANALESDESLTNAYLAVAFELSQLRYNLRPLLLHYAENGKAKE